MGITPSWDEAAIEEHIIALEGPEPDDDFDYDEAREAHRERERDEREEWEDIENLFSTLDTSEDETG